MRSNYLISVFIPVYNGEKYLNETLLSIINQTYSNLEILIVDDSSTDSSLEILNDFASKDKRIKIFKKENGGSVPKSLNFVMPHLKGDFFYYSSQDDVFSEDLIEKMVNRQIETQADTVLPDMEFYFQNKTNTRQIIGLNGNRNIELSGKEALIKSLNWEIHGFALFRMFLFKKEFFPEDAFDSDEYITRKLFLQSNKVVFSEGMFFYRQDNTEAITKSFSNKNFYVLNTYKKLYELLKENKIEKEYLFENQCNIIRQYFRFLVIHDFYKYESECDKKKNSLFLIEFKKVNLTNAFYFENFIFALKQSKIKFLIYILILKIPALFHLVKKRFYKKHFEYF